MGGPDALSRNVHGDTKQAPDAIADQEKEKLNMLASLRTVLDNCGRRLWDDSNQDPDAIADQREEEITWKEARLNMLASLRAVLDEKYTAPDPELDVSDAVIASMELGIRSVSWEMVKKELQNDAKFGDLSTWIQKGCIGPATTLPLHIKPFWKLRGNLRCTDSVPVFDESTIWSDDQ